MIHPTNTQQVAINPDSALLPKRSCLDRREFISTAAKVSAAIAARLTLGWDRPAGWDIGDILGYRLKVVDVCRGGKVIYTSKTIHVAF